MLKWQKEYIVSRGTSLMSEIRCRKSLLAHLKAYNAISIADVSKLDARGKSGGDLDKSYHLLEIMMTRQFGYESLAKALFEDNQTGALFDLLDGFEGQSREDPISSCGIEIDRDRILSKTVIFEGVKIPLSNIISLSDTESMNKIFDRELNLELLRAQFDVKDIQVSIETIPSSSTLYVERSLILTNELEIAFFKDRSDDIFLIEDIGRSELTRLAMNTESNRINFNLTGRSSNLEDGVFKRFNILEHENHFYQLVSKTGCNVHWIRHKESNFYLVLTSNIGSVRKYIKNSQKLIKQTDLVNNLIRAGVNVPVLLCDKPGMGKSMLLASIAKSIKNFSPVKNAIFLEMTKFVRAFENSEREVNQNTVVEVLVEQICVDEFGKRIQAAIFNKQFHLIELFLDSYDEVPFESREKAIEILHCLIKNCSKIRVHLTSRPHNTYDLEQIFGVTSYKMQPFLQTEQLAIFTDALKCEWPSKTDGEINELAVAFLKDFKFKISDRGSNIIGIPLQCKMLASVYCSEINQSKVFSLKIDSVHQLYKLYTESKYKVVVEQDVLSRVYRAHLKLSLAKVLPTFFNYVVPEKLAETLCTVGIVERQGLSSVDFIHRTYAEYFVAAFAIDLLKNKTASITSKTTSVNFLFKNIFSTAEDSLVLKYRGKSYSWFKFKTFNNRVITYFLNSALSDSINEIDFTYWQTLIGESIYFSEENFANSLWSCVSGDFYCIFKLFLQFYGCQKSANTDNSSIEIYSHNALDYYFSRFVGSPLYSKCKELTCWNDIVLTVSHFSSMQLVKLVEMIVQSLTEKPLSELEYAGYLTPLHVALRRGDYDIAENFIDIYRNKLPTFNFLLHECLFQSTENDSFVITAKIDILKLLIAEQPQLLNTVDNIVGYIPLLTEDVHFQLVKFLIEDGRSDIHAKSNTRNIAHIVSEYFSPADFHLFVEVLVEQNKYKLFHAKNSDGNTPIHVALENIEIECETISLLSSKCEVEFNAKNNKGETALFVAISSKRSLRLVNKIIESGGNTFEKDSKGHSTLCYSLMYNNIDTFSYLLKKGVSPNHRCDYLGALNIWRHALQCDEGIRKEVLKLLGKNSINSVFNVSHYDDKFGEMLLGTPLYFALACNLDIDTIDYLNSLKASKYTFASIFLNLLADAFLFLCLIVVFVFVVILLVMNGPPMLVTLITKVCRGFSDWRFTSNDLLYRMIFDYYLYFLAFLAWFAVFVGIMYISKNIIPD